MKTSSGEVLYFRCVEPLAIHHNRPRVTLRGNLSKKTNLSELALKRTDDFHMTE